MLAKLTSKNQITLPRRWWRRCQRPSTSRSRSEDGRIVLTPVRVQRADAVRDKLAALGIRESDVATPSSGPAAEDDRPRRARHERGPVGVGVPVGTPGMAAGGVAIGAGHPGRLPRDDRRVVACLAYPKFGLSPEEQELLLADFLPYAEAAVLPTCCRPTSCLPRSRRCRLHRLGLRRWSGWVGHRRCRPACAARLGGSRRADAGGVQGAVAGAAA